MPYKDKEKQKEYQRKWVKKKFSKESKKKELLERRRKRSLDPKTANRDNFLKLVSKYRAKYGDLHKEFLLVRLVELESGIAVGITNKIDVNQYKQNLKEYLNDENER